MQHLDRCQSVMVAFSGGPDSVYLVEHLRDHYPDMRLTLVYFNHQLRDPNCLEQEKRFVRDYANKHQLKFVLKKLPVQTFATRNGVSHEMAGRSLRYKLLAHLAQLFQVDALLTAHHLDDDIEGLFIKLIRGSKTHLHGVKASRPFILPSGNAIPLIRPLLHLPKAEILAFLEQRNLAYCIDETNYLPSYLRNRIRHTVLPAIRGISPQVNGQLKSSIEYLNQVSDYIERQLASVLDQVAITEQQLVLAKQHLQGLDPFLVQQVYFSLLRKLRNSFDPELYILEEHVLALSSGQSLISLPNQWEAFQDDAQIVLRKSRENTLVFPYAYQLNLDEGVWIEELQKAVRLKRLDRKPNSVLSTEQKVYLDADQLKFPLLIRTRREGDRFQPIGCDYEKRLKRYLIDRKIPKETRDHLPLFFSQNRLVWVAGQQVADFAKITEHTKICVELSLA